MHDAEMPMRAERSLPGFVEGRGAAANEKIIALRDAHVSKLKSTRSPLRTSGCPEKTERLTQK